MNWAILISLCGLAQLAILFSQSQWVEALAAGVAVCAILAAFAYTRVKWDPHVDMFLVMICPGGLGMLIGAMLSGTADCHLNGFNLPGFLGMSGGMLAASVPLCWFHSRCLIDARKEGRGVAALLIDVVGILAEWRSDICPACWCIPPIPARSGCTMRSCW